MLCENCYQREATCHIDTIKDGVVTRRDLCIECCKATAPEAMELGEAKSDDRCEYCGAPAVSGWESVIRSVDGTTDRARHFVCEECQKAGRA